MSARFGQTDCVAAKKMLDAPGHRHEAIAGDLADLETPNFRRLDVAQAFQTQLQQALATRSVPQIENLKPRPEPEPAAVASTRDGNAVQLETELAHPRRDCL